MHKFIFTTFSTMITIALMSTSALAASEKASFLQNIQARLTAASGIKGRLIKVIVTKESKRVVALTPSTISLSYGFLKQMKDVNQITMTLAHLTAHIGLDYLPTPPLPEDHIHMDNKKSLKDFITPKYPDESYVPEATGPFTAKDQDINIKRPSYQNKNYDYAVNKAGIVKAEQELDVDKTTDKIIRRAGFCPSDYSRMLHYFYENPQLLLGNKHFVLDADQWPRIGAVDNRADPAAKCTAEQNALTRKYAPAFDQLMVRVRQALKK
ncbi:MAG: hypothetical protein GXP00_04705 [Alphaproteobacteria bacterium]|nr:hypothetical protein [Alphaproteobacteria bacterium]